MIPVRPPARDNAPRWQQELAAAVDDPVELLRLVGLCRDDVPLADPMATGFALRVPHAYIRRMRRGDPRDPLLLQVLPQQDELAPMPGFGPDPLAEAAVRHGPALLHKYRGRALLVTTGACAVHCRYCFRRHFSYEADPGYAQALHAVQADSSIRELILSGGDPLVLSDQRLASLFERLAGIAHLQRLRIHTRLPVVLPSRVDAGLLDVLKKLRWPLAIVLHVNHGNEIDNDLRAACAALRDAGATLLNQSVLLRGVNDDVQTLAALSEGLYAAGVLPYYLHLLDRVQGAAHFEVTAESALDLMAALRARLPGYLVPRLAREVAGAQAKQILA